ncbi:hypothetical protein V5O48_011151 [Marasmius crinis-equi]|uniref:CHAT domain-containing protein n=1 Tax=Marasmius crinis-equi TaxID=585013 RepID=A0ABR3F6G2_9AGAR
MASAKANIFYFGDAKDVGLLDQAIEWAKLAIDCAVPPELELDAQIEAYGMLSALLAYRLVDRYCRGPTDAVPVPDSPRSAADPFNDAMLVAKKVVSLTSKGSALYPAALLQHAFNTLLYGRVFSSKETRRQAMSEFRCAAEAAGNDLRVRTQALLGWASTAYDIQDWYSCMRAHQKLLNNVEDLVWLGLSTSQQIQLISREELGVCELGSHSARAAVCNGSIATALGWLDQCRSIAWQKISNLRVSSTRLARIAPDLARELQVVSRTLEEGTFQDHLSGVGGDVAYEVDRQRRHRAAEEWNHLINKVRSVQGFESFLRPKTAEQLSSLDLDGYVVVLNVHEDRCDAFILHGGITDIRLCRLDPMRLNQAIATNLYYKLQSATTRSNLSRGDELRRSVPCHGRNPNKIMADVLSDLWDSLVKPILDFINLEPYNKGSTPPRLWWCPNGPLTFLPLHAAGLYDTSNRGTKVYEYVASSYTPTVSMLADKLDRQHLENLKGFLAVSQPSGNPSIPKTVEEVESVVAVTKQHDPAMEILWLNETGATAKSVLDGMTEYSWIHLACHASQDHINPLDSEFMLYDRPLKLSEIAAHAHPHADFAFLSACQTATGDPKTMEEAVHLAAGMLVVGFRSVVATMWSVRDRDAPIVADAFYQKLFSGGKVNGGMSGIALHHAIMTLRERVGAEEFMSWVPFIHVGA